MKKIKLLLLTCLVLLQVQVNAQRIEYDLDEGESHKLITMGDQGALVFYDTGEKSSSGKEQWKFDRLDQNLKTSESNIVEIDKKFSFEKYYENDGTIYLLFANSTGKYDYEIVQYGIDKGGISKSHHQIDKHVAILDFIVTDGVAYLGGSTILTGMKRFGKLCCNMATCFIPYFIKGRIADNKPILAKINLSNNHQEMLSPEELKGQAIVSSLNKNSLDNNFTSMFIHSPKKKIINLNLEEYNRNGKLIRKSSIKPGNENNILLMGKPMQVSEDKNIVIGTYTDKKRRAKFAVNNYGAFYGVRTTGLYFTTLNNGKQGSLKYHPFSDFSSSKYFDNSYNNYTLLFHDIMVNDDEYIIVAEAFYPEYDTERITTYYSDGRAPTTTYKQVFVGFRWTHAFVAGFDHTGHLKWDHIFPVYSSLSKVIKERVHIAKHDKGRLTLIYTHNNNIKSKKIVGAKVIKDTDIAEISSSYDADNVKWTNEEEVEHWYDDYMIASGAAKVKNKEMERGDKRRKVFYINKISYD